jgi:hypothetical protein
LLDFTITFFVVGTSLTQDDLEAFETGAFMILPKNNKGQCVISYDPIKAISKSFEAHARCLRHCLSQVAKPANEENEQQPQALVMLVFLDQEFIESKVTFAHSFVSLLRSFPTVQIDFIHFFLVPVGLGWYSYQDLAKQIAAQLFGQRDEQCEFHILPPEDDDEKDSREENIVEDICIVYGFQQCNLPPRLGGSHAQVPFSTSGNVGLELTMTTPVHLNIEGTICL